MTASKSDSRQEARRAYWKRHDRKSYQCPDCGRIESQLRTEFQVHHRDGDPSNNDPSNQVALCRPCHNLREGKKPSIRDIRHLRNQINPDELSPSVSEAEEPRKCDICKRTHEYDFQTHGAYFDLCSLCNDTFEWAISGKKPHISREEIHRLRNLWIDMHPDAAVITDLTQLSRGDRIAVTDSNYVVEDEFWVYSVSREGFMYANYDEVPDEITNTGTPNLHVQRVDESPPARSIRTKFQTFLDNERAVRYNTESFEEDVNLHRYANGLDTW